MQSSSCSHLKALSAETLLLRARFSCTEMAVMCRHIVGCLVTKDIMSAKSANEDYNMSKEMAHSLLDTVFFFLQLSLSCPPTLSTLFIHCTGKHQYLFSSSHFDFFLPYRSEATGDVEYSVSKCVHAHVCGWVWVGRVLLPLWTLHNDGRPKLWSIIYLLWDLCVHTSVKRECKCVCVDVCVWVTESECVGEEPWRPCRLWLIRQN